MKITIDCDDKDFVKDYSVSLMDVDNDNLKQNLSNGIVEYNYDGSPLKNSGVYKIKAVANPVAEVVEGYKLVLTSNESDIKTITKIDGACDFTVANGKLILSPISTLDTSGGKSYTLDLKIGEISINNHHCLKMLENIL